MQIAERDARLERMAAEKVEKRKAEVLLRMQKEKQEKQGRDDKDDED